jgi:hypothetical protein
LILRSRDLSAFELKVAGYQFPGFSGDVFDNNWLVVEGRVAPADERAWEFRDPALLTWEVERLSDWLPWFFADDAGVDDLYIDLRVDNDDLHAASKDLRRDLTRFPPRAVE